MQLESIEKHSIAVLGIGKAGIRIAELLKSLKGASSLKIGIADSDKSPLDSSKIENVFPVGIEWTQGLGCGGDALKGERVFSHSSRHGIEPFFQGSSLLIICGGMGGGTASGGAPVLARIAKKMGIPSIFVVTLPFSFEGHHRRNVAEKELESLAHSADVVIPIPNDILYSTLSSDTSAEEAFSRANSEIARAILGISEIVKSKNILSGDFSELKSALGKRKSSCCIGIGVSTLSEPGSHCVKACEMLIDSPLLGGLSQIRNADALFVAVSGGKEVSIGEINQSLGLIEKHVSENARMVLGVSGDPAFDGIIQITVLAIKYEDSPEINKDQIPSLPPRPAHGKNKQKSPSSPDIEDPGVQPGLPLISQSRGIFTNSSKNMFNGEDLDIPTFQRREYQIDDGRK